MVVDCELVVDEVDPLVWGGLLAPISLFVVLVEVPAGLLLAAEALVFGSVVADWLAVAGASLVVGGADAAGVWLVTGGVAPGAAALFSGVVDVVVPGCVPAIGWLGLL